MLEHVKCSTPDFAEQNVEKLLKLFPECAGERGTVDLDKLRGALTSKVVEGNVERYEFTWPGKRAAKAAASAATTKTLRPCREESVNFDETENLYIEGDNLEVLKLLQTSYAGKVKMIYIDPPYNTGHDFVYRDRFSLTDKELAQEGGAFDEDGNRFEVNDSAEARYHSNWCSMMYPRLKLARNLLREDGVLFMSIDDNELDNALKISDDIFGRINRLAILVWKKKYTGGKGTSTFADYHEYIVSYSKDIDSLGDIAMMRPEEEKGKFTEEDEYVAERGRYYTRPLKSNLDPRPTLVYPIELPDGTSVTTQWICAKDTFEQMKREGRILFKESSNSKWPVYKKFYENDSGGTVKIPSFIEVSSNNDAKEELKSIFEIAQTRDLPFQTPKPIKLIRLFTDNFTDKDSIVLDFFSGSASTAHAVMQLNAEDGGKRKFIMVQLPEVCAEDSEAAKAGYKNICEIGKERIRRAGKKIAEENATTAPNLDIGFRVLKLDSSSVNDTSATVGETDQTFANFARIKEGRSSEDLLFQMLLETHIPLSDKIERKTIGGNEVFFVSGNALVACLGEKAKMTTEFFVEVAKLRPGVAFFRDDAFADDSARTNLQQAFDQFSPSTSIKVI